MKENNKSFKRYLGFFIFAVAIITIYKTIDSVGVVFAWFQKVGKILAPFGLAVLLAYLLYFPSRKIERWYKKSKWKFVSRKARFLSIVTIYLLVVIGIVLLIKVIFPLLYQSIVDLVKSLPNYYNKAVEVLEKQPEDSIWTKINLLEKIKKLENFPSMIMKYLDLNNISKYAETITNVASAVFDIFITLVVSYYILSERSDIKSFLKNLCHATFSQKGYNKIVRYYGKINDIFYKFISAQIFDAFIVGIITTIAMLIMNVKYAALLGFLIGLFNIIPYFGAIVAVGIAVILTIFTGGWSQALWLALVIIILQQIDANIINPKILGDSLQISRILVVLSVTLFGSLFGVIGMFLAVPTISLIKVFVFDYIEEREKKKELEAVKKEAEN